MLWNFYQIFRNYTFNKVRILKNKYKNNTNKEIINKKLKINLMQLCQA